MIILKKLLKEYSRDILQQVFKEQEEKQKVHSITFQALIDAFVKSIEVPLTSIKSAKTAHAFDISTLGTDLKVISKDDEQFNLSINLEDLFSYDGVSELKGSNYIVEPGVLKFAELEQVKLLLRAFCIFINYFFSGLTSVKQTTKKSFGFSAGFKSVDTNEFKTSFIWDYLSIKNSMYGGRLFSNQNLASGASNNVSNKLNYEDLIVFKVALLYIFDSPNEIQQSFGLNVYATSRKPKSQYFKLASTLMHFMTASMFEGFILDASFTPSSELTKKPDYNDFKGVLLKDNPNERSDLHDLILSYTAYLKYQILRHAQQYGSKEPKPMSEQRIPLTLVQKAVALFEENSQQESSLESIVANIDDFVSNVGRETSKKSLKDKDLNYNKERLIKLLEKPEIAEQTVVFKDILMEKSVDF